MSNQRRTPRATPEQWAQIERSVEEVHGDGCSALLELRARVEALEAAQRATTMDELRAASAEARSGGLVEGVAKALHCAPHPPGAGDWTPEARAAIREVAAWLRTGRLLHAAELLEMEADR